MAEFVQKEGTGSLWPNKYHKAGDTKPCLQGSFQWHGEKVEIAVWAPKGEKKPYFIIVQEPKENRQAQQQPAQDAGWNDSPSAAAAPTTPPPATPPKAPVNRSSLLR